MVNLSKTVITILMVLVFFFHIHTNTHTRHQHDLLISCALISFFFSLSICAINELILTLTKPNFFWFRNISATVVQINQIIFCYTQYFDIY